MEWVKCTRCKKNEVPNCNTRQRIKLCSECKLIVSEEYRIKEELRAIDEGKLLIRNYRRAVEEGRV